MALGDVGKRRHSGGKTELKIIPVLYRRRADYATSGDEERPILGVGQLPIIPIICNTKRIAEDIASIGMARTLEAVYSGQTEPERLRRPPKIRYQESPSS
jgi:hypothetical protein